MDEHVASSDSASGGGSRRVGRPGRRSSAIVLGTAAALVLALLGLSWRSQVELSASGADAPTVSNLVAVVFAIALVFAITASLTTRSRAPRRPRPPQPWWMLFVRVAMFGALLYLITQLDRHHAGPDRARDNVRRALPQTHGEPGRATPPGTQPVTLLLLGLVLLAALIALIYVRRVAAGASQSADERARRNTAAALVQAVTAARAALELGADERAAVIACFEAMQATLETRGVAGKGADTATDLLERAVALGVVRGPAAMELVQFFWLARYSSAPMPAGAATRAAAALSALEAETMSVVRV